MSRFLTSLCVLATAILLPLSSALAFSTIDAQRGRNVFWPRRSMPVQYHINSAGSADLEGDEFRAIQDSFQAWQDADCSFITFRYNGQTNSTAAGVGDNFNNLVWLERGWSSEVGGSGTIGVTTPIFQFDGSIIDADIRFNGVNFTWTTSSSRARTDVATIATHEIGHFLGLGHTNVRTAVMKPASGPGEVLRNLHPDDTQGVCFIYPIDGRQGSGCGSNSDCNAGLACVDGQGGRFCTATCTLGAEPDSCPDGTSCQDNGGSGACLPGSPNDGQICSPCSSSADCNGGFCVGFGGGAGACTISCAQDANCPAEFLCAPLQGGGGACVPASGNCGDGGGGNGGGNGGPTPAEEGESCGQLPCNRGLVCVGASFNDASCRRTCGGSSDCPEGQSCAQLQGGGGACVPGGGGNNGDGCMSPADCEAGAVCIDSGGGRGECAEACNTDNPECPGSRTCVPLEGGGGVCVGGGAEEGALCDNTFCAGGLVCVVADDGARCRRSCSNNGDCANGQSCQGLQDGSAACFPGGGGNGGNNGNNGPGPGADVGELCSASIACMGGMLCIVENSGDSTGRCFRQCETSADCGGANCQPVVGGGGVCSDGGEPTNGGNNGNNGGNNGNGNNDGNGGNNGNNGGVTGALGDLCAAASACNSGVCVTAGADSRCSRSCQPGDPASCPRGFECIALGDGATACWPSALSPGATFGESCDARADCISNVCVAMNGGVCSESCRGSAACPPGWSCQEIGVDSVCVENNDPGRGVGESCSSDSQCVDRLRCEFGVCSIECTAGAAACPAGFACRAITDGRGGAVCLQQDTGGSGGGGSSGCAQARSEDSALPSAALLLGMVAVALRRRRHSSVRSTNQ